MSKKSKQTSEQVGRNIAGMMCANDKAMIDFLLLMEPSLTREELEKAATEGKLWSHEFNGVDTRVSEANEGASAPSKESEAC